MKALKLKIGDAVAFRRPEEWSHTPDDRQEQHKTINGVVVEDYGHVDAGDDHAGTVWENSRGAIKKDSYIGYHENYYKLEREFWSV